MIDYFALLQQPRRPWLDPEELKNKFFSLSASVHPDRVHGGSDTEKAIANQSYSELNIAYNCLKESKDRLIHLLELELGQKPGAIDQIPQMAMDLFMEVAQLCRESDKLIAEKSKIASPLLKVQFFERGMEWSDKLSALQQRIQNKRLVLEDELKSLNSLWDSVSHIPGQIPSQKLPLDRIEQIQRSLSYLSRWSHQLQERILQLTF